MFILHFPVSYVIDVLIAAGRTEPYFVRRAAALFLSGKRRARLGSTCTLTDRPTDRCWLLLVVLTVVVVAVVAGSADSLNGIRWWDRDVSQGVVSPGFLPAPAWSLTAWFHRFKPQLTGYQPYDRTDRYRH